MKDDPVSLNVRGVSQLIDSKLNKIQGGASSDVEGVVGEHEDVLTLKLDDDELLKLSKQWEAKYNGYEGKIKPRQEANKAWYLGKQGEGTYFASNGVGISSNLIFEAVETFIPAALAKNPEPVVFADNTPEGNTISGSLKTMLQYHADALVLRAKLSEVTRSWCFNFIGVLKHGWDDEIKDIKTEVRDPQKLIFNPDSSVDAYGDIDSYVGERITVSAQKLVEMFPNHKEYVTIMADGQMGTDVTYTEWWNDDYCFYTFKERVLDKNKNPHFNYAKKVQGLDAGGNEVETDEKGKNHFSRPKKPYTFLSVFSLGDQPHDVTGLIEQNIPNQNRITQTETQIHKNLAKSNNSIALNGLHYNQETAKTAAIAMEKGNPVLDPSGNPNEGIVRFAPPSIPDAFFKASDRDKQDLRSIFGVDGLGTTPPDKQKTLGGLLNNEQHDDTRIGGGIGDRLEQVADNIFNWWVQLYYVYYDEPHFAAIMGQMKAVEYITLSQKDLDRRVIVSVSPDSMKPHDELTEMNQAMSLWEAKALDIKTLLTRLNFPDPQETAAQVWLYQTNPQLYGQMNFPELTEQIQQLMQSQAPQQGAPPQGQPAPLP